MMTVLCMRALIHTHFTFEFLSATSIVVTHQGVLEVYRLCIETPGAPPAHTASFVMPCQYRSTARIIRGPRLSQCIDPGNFSGGSPFPSPSFPLAEDNCYLTILWDLYDSAQRLKLQFHVPLSSLRRIPTYGDALAIPWETWSKDVCFTKAPRKNYAIGGERLIRFTLQPGSHCEVSAFDLNQSRAGRLGTTSADPQTDYARFHPIKSDSWPDEITMERSYPAYLASRSFSLHDSVFHPLMVCDD